MEAQEKSGVNVEVPDIPLQDIGDQPALTSAGLFLPSLGSALHGTGHCKPCVWSHPMPWQEKNLRESKDSATTMHSFDTATKNQCHKQRDKKEATIGSTRISKGVAEYDLCAAKNSNHQLETTFYRSLDHHSPKSSYATCSVGCTLLIFTVGVECGENRGRTGGEPGGEPGENRGRTGGARKNRGKTGGIWEENRGRPGGFWYAFTKEYRGRSGGFGTRTGGEPGWREFSLEQETQLGT